MRQHVNPLSRYFQLAKELPRTHQIFLNDSLPLHLDIGSAKGRFLIDLAQIDPNRNYLGVEIRQALVISAEKVRERLDLNNLKFLFCNANVSLEDWLVDLRPNQLQMVSIQFPDPCFKRKHFKRRVLQPSLLISLTKALNKGSELFIQSDIYEVVKTMSQLIEASNCFVRKNKDETKWGIGSPFKVMTEREEYVENCNMPVFRELYVRNGINPPSLSMFKDDYAIM